MSLSEIPCFDLKQVSGNKRKRFYYVGPEKCGKSLVLRDVAKASIQPNDTALVITDKTKTQIRNAEFGLKVIAFAKPEYFDDMKITQPVCILEDLTNQIRSKEFSDLIFNRDLRDVHLSLQNLHSLSPAVRSQADYVFLFEVEGMNIKRRLYEEFASSFESFDQCVKIFDAITSVKYRCMVLDLTTVPSKIFWYRSSQ